MRINHLMQSASLLSFGLAFDAETTEGGDTATAEAPAAESTADADKPKLTIDLVKERRVFDSLEDAGVALGAIAAAASDWQDVIIVAPGAHFTDEGEFVPDAEEWIAETHEVMLAPLATKAVKDKDGNVTKPAKLIALVFAPIPRLSGLLDDEKGAAMVAEVIRKELNHRAVRKLRTAENVLAAASEMPMSIESYAEAQTGTGGGVVAFDDHWLLYSQALAKIVATGWGARFPAGRGKAAIRGAVENAAKALALFPELEQFGPKKESLFVRLLQGVISAATKAGQDTTLLQAWLDTRDQQTYDPTADATGDLDLDSLFADMAEPEPEAETGDETGDDDAGDPPTVSDETGEAESTE